MSQAATKMLFNRARLIANKSNMVQNVPQFAKKLAPLFDYSAYSIRENLSAIKRVYSNVAYLGSSASTFFEDAPANLDLKNIFICDICNETLNHTLKELSNNQAFKNKFPQAKVYPLIMEEELWPFDENSLDLIVSNLNMHWVNEMQVALTRMHESLKPDGTIIGSVFGEETLQELRIAFTLAENERYGGVSPHVSPFISITEIGNLISRIKYNIPTVFSEKIIINFDSSVDLMQYLQEIGEQNANKSNREGIFKDTLYGTIAVYNSLFKDQDINKIYATFEIIHFNGWKYHENQSRAHQRKNPQEFTIDKFQKELEGQDPEVAKTIRSGEIIEEEIIEKYGPQSTKQQSKKKEGKENIQVQQHRTSPFQNNDGKPPQNQ